MDCIGCSLQVIDIEEVVWAPRYGLKGMIDASIRVKMNSSNEEASEKIIPLEFKTGKAISGQVNYPKEGLLLNFYCDITTAHIYGKSIIINVSCEVFL